MKKSNALNATNQEYERIKKEFVAETVKNSLKNDLNSGTVKYLPIQVITTYIKAISGVYWFTESQVENVLVESKFEFIMHRFPYTPEKQKCWRVSIDEIIKFNIEIFSQSKILES